MTENNYWKNMYSKPPPKKVMNSIRDMYSNKKVTTDLIICDGADEFWLGLKERNPKAKAYKEFVAKTGIIHDEK
jgi:hypothetical protein